MVGPWSRLLPPGGCWEKIPATDEIDKGDPFTCPLTTSTGVAVDRVKWYPLRAVVFTPLTRVSARQSGSDALELVLSHALPRGAG